MDPAPGAAATSEALLARIAELQRAVAARDRFIAAVGHELRNTMAPMTLIVDAFTASADPAVLERRMQMLARNLKQMTATIDRVHDVAQLRSEKLVLQLEPVELGAVVRAVVEDAHTVAVAAGVELRVYADEVTGSWDRARVRQIASHLITNAIRHSGGGPVDVSVGARDAEAVLLVADRGRGIQADRRERLFDAFDSSTAQRGAGLGVGLWIVRTLCAQFGGTVSLVDDHAPGACFRVVLPMYK